MISASFFVTSATANFRLVIKARLFNLVFMRYLPSFSETEEKEPTEMSSVTTRSEPPAIEVNEDHPDVKDIIDAAANQVLYDMSISIRSMTEI